MTSTRLSELHCIPVQGPCTGCIGMYNGIHNLVGQWTTLCWIAIADEELVTPPHTGGGINVSLKGLHRNKGETHHSLMVGQNMAVVTTLGGKGIFGCNVTPESYHIKHLSLIKISPRPTVCLQQQRQVPCWGPPGL